MYNLIGQVFGIIGSIFFILSFQTNDKQKLLKKQIIATSFMALQYFFIAAFTGFFMNVTTTLRNILFKKYDNKKIPIIYMVIILSLMVFLTYISYVNVFSLLPCIAVIGYTFALYSGKLKYIRLSDLIGSICFLIYNIKVFAVASIITSLIQIIADIIAILKFDKKEK